MTLCIAWRQGNEVHIASDSRLTLAANSHADVGIKVVGMPYQIYGPAAAGEEPEVDFSGEIGMCFAGSAVNSLMLKETVSAILREIQHIPGIVEPSMEALARFIFRTYRVISKQVSGTSLAGRGMAAIVVTGCCPILKTPKTFHFSTDANNEHHFAEVLTIDGEYIMLGSGAKNNCPPLPERPSGSDFLKLLRDVIRDDAIDSVGGSIQYGKLSGQRFKTFGIVDRTDAIHLWRGAIDLNDPDMAATGQELCCMYSYIDPFKALPRAS